VVLHMTRSGKVNEPHMPSDKFRECVLRALLGEIAQQFGVLRHSYLNNDDDAETGQEIS
jgi:hypothetical protein